ncbi:uncharacterized protein PHACADRAFT_149901 [Phanerochaete carnosa HHB-10118-sp]|uniref:Uncharacterized protein n=1 Tax=Phanerochaete carnosa (strain HHB-10118-sp) TaxID=650164 RepID=K5UNZ6_PHACS|nr:uncharacterized protein PHACADRAFT_149901 [Phanerochaete carnosa HHB-10118-sp]EKM51481.1 hypothetical protein PHACADRAFT_149901 [Phanerochaete carnosa HHB-10118-sp]
MGGNAFRTLLPDAIFPRMDPGLYAELKELLTSRLQTVYALVAVPHEAPDKKDFGDLDFVVCQPFDGLVREEKLRTALGAQHIITHGSTSNLAIPMQDKNSYCQADIQVCDDSDDWQRTAFFLSYGDLGMILGLLARPAGLSLGRHGLKLADPLPTSPPVSLHLSSSMSHILDFFTLPMDRWQQGFSSEMNIFVWLSSSRLFNTATLLRCEAVNTSRVKARDARPMYQRFLEFVRRRETSRELPSSTSLASEAIDFFGQRNLFDVLLHIAIVKKHIRDVFTGTLIQDWTGIRGMPVRFIKDETKERLGGEDKLSIVVGIPLDSLQSDDIPPEHLTLRAWEYAMARMSADGVKTMVMEVKEELDAAGRLQYDWKAAKQKKVER